MKLMLLLQSNKKMSVDEIAEYFSVSRRTVFRDMRVLNEINVPITWDRDAGYGIMRGYTIPPLMFTPRELGTIIVGLSFVKSQIDATMVVDAKDVELKIQNMLPGELKEFMLGVSDKTIVDPNYINKNQKKKGGNWFSIYNAIAEHRPIQFHYQSGSASEPTDRKMDPYLMVHYYDHWNVIGYCHLRNAPRNFRLNRMSSVTVLNDDFKSKDNYTNDELLYHHDGMVQSIELYVNNSVLEELVFNLPARVTNVSQTSDGALISFDFDNLDFINNWLMRFTDKIKINKPKQLVQKRKELINRLSGI
ncbi:MAG TPA: YafY family protein [Balneolales bacterium]|nr:YafY family protein [Balneolales bacterium]